MFITNWMQLVFLLNNNIEEVVQLSFSKYGMKKVNIINKHIHSHSCSILESLYSLKSTFADTKHFIALGNSKPWYLQIYFYAD